MGFMVETYAERKLHRDDSVAQSNVLSLLQIDKKNNVCCLSIFSVCLKLTDKKLLNWMFVVL